MATVENLLKTKGHLVFSVTPENTVLDALKLMAEKNIGAVMVMEGNHVEGIFSERDYARRGILMGNSERQRSKRSCLPRSISSARMSPSNPA